MPFRLSLHANALMGKTVAILILRLYVMYGCNKRLLAFLCTFLCLELLAETIIIGTSAAKMQSSPSFTFSWQRR